MERIITDCHIKVTLCGTVYCYGNPRYYCKTILRIYVRLDTKFVPVYTEVDYSHINWDIHSIEVESYKELAKNVVKKRIKGENATEAIEKLNDFYMKKYDENYKPGEMTIDHL